MKRTKRTKRTGSTAFVPGIVFATTFAGVVPSCAGNPRPMQSPVANMGYGVAAGPTPPTDDAASAPSDGARATRSENILLAYVAFDGSADATDAITSDPDAAIATATDAGRANRPRRRTR